jgi:hypothetical protein
MAFAEIRGQTGEIKAGGRRVAGLVNWLALRNATADTWEIGAGLVDVNPVWLAGLSTMDVCLDVGKQQWRWRRVPMADVQVAESSIHVVAHGRFER